MVSKIRQDRRDRQAEQTPAEAEAEQQAEDKVTNEEDNANNSDDGVQPS